MVLRFLLNRRHQHRAGFQASVPDNLTVSTCLPTYLPCPARNGLQQHYFYLSYYCISYATCIKHRILNRRGPAYIATATRPCNTYCNPVLRSNTKKLPYPTSSPQPETVKDHSCSVAPYRYSAQTGPVKGHNEYAPCHRQAILRSPSTSRR